MSKLNVALIQTSLVWENPMVNLENISKKIESITNSVDLIILPEMFTTGFTMCPENTEVADGQKTVDWMVKVASKKNTAIAGSIVFSIGKSFCNRLFFIKPEGEIIYYDKRHSFTLSGEDKVYTSGVNKLIVNYKGFKIRPLICYDLRFPVWSRNVENYDVLIYVANWPKTRINAWDTLLKARAIENMAYCIGVNRVGVDKLGHEYPGHSAVYDVLGNALSFSDTEEIIYATLTKEHITTNRAKFKFLDDKDNFTLTN
jgi:predicted amidohydrolase